MNTFISIGDFIDIYFKFLLNGRRFFTNRLKLNDISRIKNAWQQNPIPSPHWWSIQQIRERWNKIITGNSTTEYPEFVVKKYLQNKNNLRLISPGCGSGSKETKFAIFKQFSRVEGFDLSPNRIQLAKQNAQQLELKNLHYFVDDVYKHDFGFNQYDVVLFDSCLHHFKNLDQLLEKIYNSITPDGCLIINEYVGPIRFQWKKNQLKQANHCLRLIPPEFRKRWKTNSVKRKIYRPGYLRMILSDPSEAVNSTKILPAIKKRFKRIEEIQYGGDLLHLLFRDIAHNFLQNSNETEKILNKLFEIEDEFLKENDHSDFVFGIYGR